HARDVLRFRMELPDDVHAAGDALDMAVADRGLVRVAAHLGDPPRRITERAAEVPPCGHLDDAVGESTFFPEVDVAVVRQDLGPALDVGGDEEAEASRRAHEALVDGDHGASDRWEPSRKDSAMAGESKRCGGSRAPVAAISAAAAAGARARRRIAASASAGRRVTWSIRCWSARASRSVRRRRMA